MFIKFILVISSVVEIVSEEIRAQINKEDKKLDRGLTEIEQIRNTQSMILERLNNLTSALEVAEKMSSKIPDSN